MPLKKGRVSMYVCGPTVYQYLHIGNFRGAVFFNLVRNWLEHLGYKVTYVLNYTDVDDKIIQTSKEENIDALEVADKYIKAFQEDYSQLKLKPQDHNPRITGFMKEIIAFIEDLMKKKKAYAIETPYGKDIVFDIKAFQDYGKLSNKNLEEMEAGFRIEVSKDKKNACDFLLWKASKPEEPSWPSPWGQGRPGWHIECSTMSQCLLGEQIDIHGGGLDLIFPHHENEIAQSEARTGKPFVKYWIHHNMLDIQGEKMSKSLGNIIKARDFFSQYHPEIYKYMILSSHYRSVIDFSETQIETAISRLARIYSAMKMAQELSLKGATSVFEKFEAFIKKSDDGVIKALNDDFNTVEMLARVFEAIREFNKLSLQDKKNSSKTFLTWISKISKLTALFQEEPAEYLQFLDDFLLKKKNLLRPDIDKLVEDRIQARKQKNYQKSDEIRHQLEDMGILLKDFGNETSWEVKKA